MCLGVIHLSGLCVGMPAFLIATALARSCTDGSCHSTTVQVIMQSPGQLLVVISGALCGAMSTSNILLV